MDPAKVADFEKQSSLLNSDFPMESYNKGNIPGLPSLPYEINIIVPEKVFADVYGFNPVNIREQLYCGCVAADRIMSKQSIGEFISNQCAQRFPRLGDAKTTPQAWSSDVCRVEPPPKQD